MKLKLEGMHISGAALSDLFFNYPGAELSTSDESLTLAAAEFAATLGHADDQELITALVTDFKERL